MSPSLAPFERPSSAGRALLHRRCLCSRGAAPPVQPTQTSRSAAGSFQADDFSSNSAILLWLRRDRSCGTSLRDGWHASRASVVVHAYGPLWLCRHSYSLTCDVHIRRRSLQVDRRTRTTRSSTGKTRHTHDSTSHPAANEPNRATTIRHGLSKDRRGQPAQLATCAVVLSSACDGILRCDVSQRLARGTDSAATRRGERCVPARDHGMERGVGTPSPDALGVLARSCAILRRARAVASRAE